MWVCKPNLAHIHILNSVTFWVLYPRLSGGEVNAVQNRNVSIVGSACMRSVDMCYINSCSYVCTIFSYYQWTCVHVVSQPLTFRMAFVRFADSLSLEVLHSNQFVTAPLAHVSSA